MCDFLFLAVLGCYLCGTCELFAMLAWARELKTSTLNEKWPELPGTVVEPSWFIPSLLINYLEGEVLCYNFSLIFDWVSSGDLVEI